jgi:hypothetical protein
MDSADELMAERRLHAAVDDGILTEDDIRLSNMMRRLLRGAHTITYYPGSHVTLSLATDQFKVTPDELAVVQRLRPRDGEIDDPDHRRFYGGGG